MPKPFRPTLFPAGMKKSLPNLLTLSRIPFLFVIAGLLFVESRGAATLTLVIFIIAGLTDWLDGACARRFGVVSDFGKFMDALTDKILVMGLFTTVIVVPGLVPTWFLGLVLLMLCREFLITGMRMMAASRGVVLGAEKAGKQKTVSQIIALGLILLIPVLERDIPWETGAMLARWSGAACFVLAAFLTVSSGLKYFFKYRHCLLDPGQN